jgi:hypothetical protein
VSSALLYVFAGLLYFFCACVSAVCLDLGGARGLELFIEDDGSWSVVVGGDDESAW